MCKAMGLDLSLTSTGVAIIQADGTSESMTIRSKFRDEARLADLRDKILATVKLHRPKLVVLEGYSYGSVTSLASLAELGGLVKTGLFEVSQPVLVVPPARVKKFATGKGNSKKDEVRLAVYKRWGFEAPTNDEVDAYVLARTGLAFLGHDSGLIRSQIEVIEALKKAV